jgi:hypothetical protein
MLRKRSLKRLTVPFLLIAIMLLGLVAATAATADRFYASRIVAWRDADFRDFERFPSRPCPQGGGVLLRARAPRNPPEYLRTVTYRREAPEPKTPRESMATALDSSEGTEVTEPLDGSSRTQHDRLPGDPRRRPPVRGLLQRLRPQLHPDLLLGGEIVRVCPRRRRHRGGPHRQRRRPITEYIPSWKARGWTR